MTKPKCQYLIDGENPIQKNPLLTVQSQIKSKSADLKGLVLELIEVIYPPLICPVCFHTSTGRAEADQHVKENHSGIKIYSCVSPVCTQSYSSKGGLRYHLEHSHQVTLRSSAPSSTVSIPFSHNNKKKSALSESLEQKLNEIYALHICPSCKREFKKKTHVLNHLVSNHPGEEPYKCIIADCKRTKAYSTREGLVYHLVNYHDNK